MLMIYAPRFIISSLITNLKLPKRLKYKQFKEVTWLNRNENRKHQTCFQNINAALCQQHIDIQITDEQISHWFQSQDALQCITLIANHTLITFKFVRIGESTGGRDESRIVQCASPRVFPAMCLIQVLTLHAYHIIFNAFCDWSYL